MLDLIDQLDKSLFLAINGNGNGLLDGLMIFLSEKWVWIPLYLLLIFSFIRQFGVRFWIAILGVLAVVLFADQITSGLMKPYFERPRPCKDQSFSEFVRLVDRCGGQFGFASSHAANTGGIASFSMVTTKENWMKWLIMWSLLVGLSRIYLGVHYPGDVIVGFAVGVMGAAIVYTLSHRLLKVRN